MSQVCDEILIDVHKLLRMCIVSKALHTINEHVDLITQVVFRRIDFFSETNSFRCISFCQSQFRNDIKYFVTDKRR